LNLKSSKRNKKKKNGYREAEVFGLNHKFAVKVDDLDLSKLPQK
jgi:hypothetical protein